MRRYCSVVLVFLLTAFSALSVQARPVETEKWSDQFDRHFKKYSKRYFGPHFEWRWFKSQGIAESNLNENASSPAGAKGVRFVGDCAQAVRTKTIIRENRSFVVISISSSRNILAQIG